MTPKGTYVPSFQRHPLHFRSQICAFCRTPPAVIDKLDRSPTYVDFLNNHLIKNRPALIGQDLTKSWPAFHLWRNPGGTGSINWDYLANAYGAQTVSVTDCRAPPTDSCPEDTRLGEVIRGWLGAEHDSAKENQPLLYIRDWHLALWVSRNPAIQPFYTTPYLFADDWLNYHYCTFTDDDFRFVYLGIQGTSTPFHKDVYDSYSWSTNVVGRKLWTFWAPDDEARRQPRTELVQEAGETVFVYVTFLQPGSPLRPYRLSCSQSPSGWYHTVENLTTCISINHNWCNSVNLASMYDAICRRIVDVERELEDVRELLSSNAKNQEWEVEWMNIVQDVLEKDAGWK